MTSSFFSLLTFIIYNHLTTNKSFLFFLMKNIFLTLFFTNFLTYFIKKLKFLSYFLCIFELFLQCFYLAYNLKLVKAPQFLLQKKLLNWTFLRSIEMSTDLVQLTLFGMALNIMIMYYIYKND